MKKKISVIIITYNQEKYIEKAIRGVFMQNINVPVELIISNDKSTDKTDAVIRNMIKDSPENIEIIYTSHEKNLGATPNFYNALKKVTGNYVAFCEGDDFWTDANKLQIQFDFMETHPEYSICCHNTVQVDADDNIIPNQQFSSVENRDYSTFEIYKNWKIHTTSVFIKKEVLESDAAQKTLIEPDLLYFDTMLFMAATTIGKMRGMQREMSAYRRHEVGLSAGTDYKRDLRHNRLDQITGDYYPGEIRNRSNWMIFKRSYDDFFICLKNGDYNLALKHTFWILKKGKILRIYLIKKMKERP